jgi:Pyruvate/2-oxoacid:ferredoxin oxidoreductase gamma subunit
MSTQLDLPPEAWTSAIRHSVKEQFVDINLKAFEIGTKCRV